MKQWQLDANREDLLLEIHTLLGEFNLAEKHSDNKEIIRLSEELHLCSEFAERQGITYSEEELAL